MPEGYAGNLARGPTTLVTGHPDIETPTPDPRTPVPDWQTDTYQAVTLAAAAVAGLSLLLLLLVMARLRVLSRRVRRLAPGRPAESSGVDPQALRHVGVVRYDAFGDMGGRLSFSAALYDDEGNGLVISSINGRSETRTYAKPLVELCSDHTLSPEEEDAIRTARRNA
jgi:hypothetical protein